MLYSEEDVKKAVEAARQACIRNSNLTPWGGVAWFEATPDDFYRGVMAFARDPTIKVIFPRPQKASVWCVVTPRGESSRA